MNDTIELSLVKVKRNKHLLSKAVIVDGQPGCGKTLFTALISSLQRVEIFNYPTELETVCQLSSFGKIQKDAAVTMINMKLDELLYETMMSRRTNFRLTDLSSVFRSSQCFRYIKRAFQAGDAIIPDRIRHERPILNLATHNLLMDSTPVLEALEDRVLMMEIVRHPLYMIKQQMLNMQRLYDDVRDFVVYFEAEQNYLPFYAYGIEEQFQAGSDIDRAIYSMYNIYNKTESFKMSMSPAQKKRVLTISFEQFVLNPYDHMASICQLLETSASKKTRTVLKKHKVPRKKIADGIDLKIYRRCGWEPCKNISEKSELELRRDDVIKQGASEDAVKLLDNISRSYEKRYLQSLPDLCLFE